MSAAAECGFDAHGFDHHRGQHHHRDTSDRLPGAAASARGCDGIAASDRGVGLQSVAAFKVRPDGTAIPGGPAQIADFAPDNSMFQATAVPELTSWCCWAAASSDSPRTSAAGADAGTDAAGADAVALDASYRRRHMMERTATDNGRVVSARPFALRAPI